MARKRSKGSSIGSQFIVFLIVFVTTIVAILSPYIYESVSDGQVLSMNKTSIPESSSTLQTIDPSRLEDSDERKDPLEDISGDETIVDSSDLGELSTEVISSEPKQKLKKGEGFPTIITLKNDDGSGKVGQSGLMPGTPIAVVKKSEGNRVFYDSCTVAFSLEGSQSFPWAVTAGHCGNPGEEVYSVPNNNKDVIARLGTVRLASQSSYTPDTDERTGDWALISLDPEADMPSHPDFIPNALNLHDIDIDAKLCKYGSTTGYDCGFKTKESVVVTSKDDNNIEIPALQDEATMCSLPGDSGAPIFDRIGIVGVLVASNISAAETVEGKCNGNDHRAYYVPVSDVVSEIMMNTKNVVI